jgi:hypothetical protein
MALSPNYGFPEPDNSSLVKNGAQDIRALGDAIDTFLFRPFTKNAIYNSAMQIWQRGTSFAVALNTTTYTADRWCVRRGTAGETVSRQVTGDTTNLPNIQYCARVQRDSGNSSTQPINISQSFETIDAIPFAGKTVAVSYYVRRGANYSGASNALSLGVYTGTGTDENVALGYTGSALNFSVSATLTTTWQRVSATGIIPATATEIGLYVSYTPTGTAGAADYFEITGLQFEVGSQASPYRTLGESIQGELAACQRYYWRSGGDNAYQYYATGVFASTTAATIVQKYPTTMRVAPTSMEFSTLWVSDGANNFTPSNITIGFQSKDWARLDVTVTGATQYRPALLFANNSTSAFLGFSAEL